MHNKKRTLRLVLPQWQGGNSPDYAFGAELLALIAPPSKYSETIHVPVNKDFDTDLLVENGVEGETILLHQLDTTMEILKIKNPDKVIVFGGDCSISQAPFAYLNEKYNGNIGVLWLDAHPDVANNENASRLHEMVLSNLLGKGAPSFSRKVSSPIKKSHVLFAGLQYEELRSRDQLVDTLNLRYVSPKLLGKDSALITNWINEFNIKHIAVHFDLDVLSPKDFRSILPAKPYLETFEAAIGDMTLKQVIRILADINKNSEIVGLSIAEHMPWDAINLRRALSEISIFND